MKPREDVQRAPIPPRPRLRSQHAPPPPSSICGLRLSACRLTPLSPLAPLSAAVCRSLPVELLPRALLDATPLLPGAVLRSGPGTLYVDPCVVFIR